MKRAIILMMDSFGLGGGEDAHKYGDEGSNTLGHILEHYPNTNISHLSYMGLLHSLNNSCGNTFGKKLPQEISKNVWYGYAKETSSGKDTISGHWELMGCPVFFEWGYFHPRENQLGIFPKELLDKIVEKSGIKGYLGNCAGSGTAIIDEFGEEHVKTSKPIFYTSADSVFQIAVNEDIFGLDKLYDLCKIAREELYKYNIGRVIARPFIGKKLGNFKRTGNRKDYSIAPHDKTLLNIMSENNGQVIAVGKISDIFAASGITKSIKSSTLKNLFDDTIKAIKNEKGYGIIFTNFVDFDSEYGHRRDIKGYKEALEYFDSRLPEIINLIEENDLLVIVADHGCDPSWTGSDHTRENVPFILYNKNFKTRDLGKRESFCDLGQSLAKYLNLPELKHGESFIK